MKPRLRLISRLVAPLCIQLLFGSASVAAATIVKTYTADNSAFPNPERGFHNRFDLVPGGDTDFSRATNAGNTLVHSYVRLDEFRTSNISQAFLDKLGNGLAAARAQGKKVILRVAYNFGPYPDSLPDADEYWIGQHLHQLSPVLNANKDVIAYIEAGFVGAWGEWHTSTHGLDSDPAAKIRIINNMLQTIPESVQIAMRYPSDLRAAINGGANASRLGSHQDCFLASEPDDWGTWGRDSAYSIEQDKAFIAQVGLNHPVGGETCNVDSTRVNCATALTEMQQMHFSELNEDFDSNVINVFKAQGCYNTIDQKMGYRFRLLEASYSNAIGAGSTTALKFTLMNDGFASPFNPRPLFAVLDGAGGTYSFPLNADPRQWKSGQRIEISESFTLPASLPKGVYRLSLWLPDSASNLRSDARYSIRFANQGTWDSAKGLNLLATDIQVTDQTPTDPVTPTFYEAEAATNSVSGGALIVSCPACSGQSKVGYIGNNSGLLQFNNVSAKSAGNYKLTIFFTSAVARSTQLKINNGTATTVNFAGTGNWTTPASVDVNVALVAGTNKLVFSNATGWAPDIDRIQLTASGGTDTPPTTPPTTTALIINSFNDNAYLQNKNDLAGWVGANGFANGGGALSNGALVLQYNNNGWFGSDVARDISSKKYLVFVIKGSVGGEGNGFTVSLGGVTKTFAEFTTDAITTAYKTIRIDMNAHGINRTSPGQLQMTFWHGKSGQITIDEIRLE